MKSLRNSFALALVASFGAMPLASAYEAYECSVIELGQSGAVEKGTMSVKVSDEDMQKVVVNDAKDYASCGGMPAERGQEAYLVCMFANESDDVGIRRLRNSEIRSRKLAKKPIFVATKKGRGTEQLLPIPFTMASNDSKELMLMIPSGATSTNVDAIYIVACDAGSARKNVIRR